MSSKTIRLILIMMLLTVGALFITQAYWFRKSFALQETQFEEKLNIALRNVADHMLKLNNDSSSRIPPISKLSSNEFYVNTNSYFTLASLDSSIRSEFSLRNIDVEFDYIIVQAQTKEIVLGNTLFDLSDTTDIACVDRSDVVANLDLNNSLNTNAIYLNNSYVSSGEIEKFDFKVRLNNKTTYLLNSMGIWMYSSITLLLILAVFTFVIVSIFKGKKLAEMKKDFVNNMTHELKTPIANISVASDAIRNIEMDEIKLKKYANIIYNENVRLDNLVDQVLQISTIEKNDESFSLEEIDFHEVINAVLLSFDPLIQQRKGNVKLFLEAARFKLQADKIHLTNVIFNLIDNAIKYSNDGPEIAIRTSNKKDGINIEISDKGVGIKKENQQRIFEKFFRAETGDLHNTKGFGIGLSYVKLIVEKHNGMITFKSKENVGSTFKLYLPL